jgi:hypothetical protein
MIIQEGKLYVNRAGGIVGPMERNTRSSDRFYKWMGRDMVEGEYWYYSAEGKFWENEYTDANDLVDEYNPRLTDEPAYSGEWLDAE